MYKSMITFVFLKIFITFVIISKYHAQRMKKRQGEHF